MLHEFLSENAEDMPRWLSERAKGAGFVREEFFSSRIVYYPGNGTDGQPVRLFGSTGFAHCFICPDYGISRQELETELAHPRHGFKGYHSFDRIDLQERDLAAKSSACHIGRNDAPSFPQRPGITPYAFLEVLERDAGLDDAHGPERLAVLFLGADGHTTYEALFCRSSSYAPPYVVVLQDHGFGGNYSDFGRGGVMERTAIRSSVFPRYMFVAENTGPWLDYCRIPGLDGEAGGMHDSMRYLYERV